MIAPASLILLAALATPIAEELPSGARLILEPREGTGSFGLVLYVVQSTF